jgi:hypothetical protein
MSHALDIPKTERELHDLRVQEWSDMSLAALAIGLSLVATQVARQWALPFFFGGLVVAILGGRAFFRRCDLCERLAVEPAAYVIPEVGARAAAVASPAGRAALAGAIKMMLAPDPPFRRARVQLVADELAGLAKELVDPQLILDPLCAVRCKRLVTDTVESPLLNSNIPADGLRVAIVVIRRGFETRDQLAAAKRA